MPLKTGFLEWEIKKLSESLKISDDDVNEYFKDGRRVSFLLDGKLASSEGSGYDLTDANGDKWEVRSLTKGGIYFCPSFMVGSGRIFNESGFINKLKEIKGYIVSDINTFPKIQYWIIPKELVLEWREKNKLGASTKISRDKILKLINLTL